VSDPLLSENDRYYPILDTVPQEHLPVFEVLP
jgi:hypothetical protein